jgi:hypothetical protein
MNLSKNLSLKEVIKSNTATRLGIDNTPEQWEINNLRAVADNVFQPLRDHFGIPIGVSSGYRCKALNKAIGGSKYSQHMIGEALDLDADIYGGLKNSEIFNYIKKNLEWDQMIWEFGDDEEPDWVHVSYKESGNNRKQIKRAYRDSSGVYYKVI